jgi:hypothetical protein
VLDAALFGLTPKMIGKCARHRLGGCVARHMLGSGHTIFLASAWARFVAGFLRIRAASRCSRLEFVVATLTSARPAISRIASAVPLSARIRATFGAMLSLRLASMAESSCGIGILARVSPSLARMAGSICDAAILAMFCWKAARTAGLNCGTGMLAMLLEGSQDRGVEARRVSVDLGESHEAVGNCFVLRVPRPDERGDQLRSREVAKAATCCVGSDPLSEAFEIYGTVMDGSGEYGADVVGVVVGRKEVGNETFGGRGWQAVDDLDIGLQG